MCIFKSAATTLNNLSFNVYIQQPVTSLIAIIIIWLDIKLPNHRSAYFLGSDFCIKINQTIFSNVKY